jgi:hypothetical protein
MSTAIILWNTLEAAAYVVFLEPTFSSTRHATERPAVDVLVGGDTAEADRCEVPCSSGSTSGAFVGECMRGGDK